MPPPRGTFAAAHRGLSAERPENTLAAFEAAAAAGFPAIELDLRLTRDGEVVALHDASLERTTTGNGRVADIRYDELRSYGTGAGPVPRLDDVLSALDGWKGLWNLEVKASAAAEPALHLAEHHGILGRCQMTSFDPRALQQARQSHPDVSRALIVLGPPDKEELGVARDLGCGWLNVDHEYLTRPLLDQIRKAGLRTGAWTVNDPQRALALAQWGIDCVITDRREVLEALRPVSDLQPRF